MSQIERNMVVLEEPKLLFYVLDVFSFLNLTVDMHLVLFSSLSLADDRVPA